MATITMTITAEDFDRMADTAMYWGKDWIIKQHRFEPVTTNFSYKMAYWADRYLESLFCQHYLASIGFQSETHYDTASDSYLILTDYVSPEGTWIEG